MQREAVGDRAHRELAHAEVDVVARRALRVTALLPDQLVNTEPVRSAEPPISSGSTGASASIACCEALRVAIAFGLRGLLRQQCGGARGERCRQIAAHAALEFGGKLRMRRAYAAKRAFHRARPRRRARARSSRRTPPAGISNGGYGPAQRLARERDFLLAERLRRARASVPARFGEPLPMIVLQQISVGRSVAVVRRSIAASTASTSWPSTSAITCQPYASKRRGVSSVNQPFDLAVDGNAVVVVEARSACPVRACRRASRPRARCLPSGSRRRRRRRCGDRRSRGRAG